MGHAPSGEQMKKLAESIEQAVAWFDKYVNGRKGTPHTAEASQENAKVGGSDSR